MKIKVKITTDENKQFLKLKKDTVIQVEIEDYLKVAVASELGNAVLEACKAQAIVDRSIVIAYGALKGNEILDEAEYLPKYKAKCNSPIYTRCIKAVNQTAGKVLIYNDNIINAKYTTSNGGKTVSSLEYCYNPIPYLIEQEDAWDTSPKIGTGVGMSQKGAIYAAKHGKKYKEILNFYYPGTFIQSDYNETKAKKVAKMAEESIGHPYVFGALGEKCTPDNRRKYNSSAHPEVVSKCQVLKGKKKNCVDCPYNGGRIYDCRGFTYYYLKQVGVSISSIGATSQWETNSWVKKGLTKDGIPNLVCCLFKKRGSIMSHTGFHVGNGLIIHCSGEVQYSSTDDTSWTHWAIPKGLHTNEYIAAVRKIKNTKSLQKGSKGEAVTKLQTMLKSLGFNCADTKGTYGTKTVAAVKAFQEKYGLLIDGIYDKTTASILEDIYSRKAEKQG